MPWSPTQAFPHPLANIRRHSTKPTVANFVSYNFVDMLLWQGLGDIINTLRRKCLHLDILDASQALGLLHRLHIPHTYIWSPALLAKPLDWYEEIDICGFVSSPAEIDYQPPDDLFDFLRRGPPPIYVGFGSIVVDNPRQLSEIVIDAISRTGQRAIISKGWTGLDTGGLEVPEHIFLLGDCPHDWLFQHVSCVVHHGGAGTTHAGLSHGCPTIIIPFFGDQLFWGSIIAQLGVGPSPIPYKELTIGKLADAIGVALKPSTKQKAYQVSQLMNSESGLEKAISSFHDHLPLWRMRCAVCHSRPAVWKVKGSQLILSGFAMTVLVGAGLLKPNDLTLYRVIDYDTSRNPQNPLSAASQVLLGSFAKFVTDIGDVYSAMLAEIPCRSNRADDNFGFSVRRDTGPQLSSQDRNIHILKSQNFTARPIGRLCQQILNIIIIPPMEITLTISKGFHNATLLLHDDTVKSIPKVTCLRSGVKTAAKVGLEV
ncbi:hypothetical protein AbraIFM66951_006244 [Aspergillus brasiliensis]|nr:hypothetical protein AbraIFM66951_006244 [Aspergillus brasiliensis]